MCGIGVPEIFVIGIVLVFLYGIFMTIDAIRRPADKYIAGNKRMWIALFILTNPIVSRFYPGLFYLLAILAFITTSISYHINVRNRTATAEPINDSREERMRRRFEARER
jgi:hypothetical protein